MGHLELVEPLPEPEEPETRNDATEIRGRAGTDLYEHVRLAQLPEDERRREADRLPITLPIPRFRIGDTVGAIRKLIELQWKDKVTARSSNGKTELGELIETLKWFNHSTRDVKGFAKVFPRGPSNSDTTRQDMMVEAFGRVRDLSHMAIKDWRTRARVELLVKLRGVFGDSRSIMPRELAPFHQCLTFRETDSLADVQKLAIESCDAVAAGSDDVKREKLDTLRVALSRKDIFFNDIVRISGLDVRQD